MKLYYHRNGGRELIASDTELKRLIDFALKVKSQHPDDVRKEWEKYKKSLLS